MWSARGDVEAGARAGAHHGSSASGATARASSHRRSRCAAPGRPRVANAISQRTAAATLGALDSMSASSAFAVSTSSVKPGIGLDRPEPGE